MVLRPIRPSGLARFSRPAPRPRGSKVPLRHPTPLRPRDRPPAIYLLDGVKAERWRILVGDDALRLDKLVRQSPTRAYDLDFFESFAAEAGWRLRP
jgi:hypothetical protein